MISKPGGVLSGKVGMGMCDPDRVPFRPLRFTNGPFLFENWFRYRSCFCKLHNFRWIFPLVTYRLSKSAYASWFIWLKVLIGLKKGPSRSKWFSYRLQICAFSGLVIGWWSKLWAAYPYPTQSWVPPWVSKCIYIFLTLVLPATNISRQDTQSVKCSSYHHFHGISTQQNVCEKLGTICRGPTQIYWCKHAWTKKMCERGSFCCSRMHNMCFSLRGLKTLSYYLFFFFFG